MFIQSKSPKIAGVISLTIIYLIGFIAFTVISGKYDFMPYIGIQVILTIAVFIAHRSVHYAVPMLWALSIWGLLNLLGGIIPLPPALLAHSAGGFLGDLWVVKGYLTLDKCVHVYGFAVATWFSWQTLCNIIHSRYQRRLMPSLGLLLIVITSSIGYGAVVEVVEFLVSSLFHPDEMDSYQNTGWDMIANSVGALVASVIIRLRNL